MLLLDPMVSLQLIQLVAMSVNVVIGGCSISEAVPMLMTSHYYYIGILYWLRQEKLRETVREQWNNGAHRRRQWADTRSHAFTDASGTHIWQWDVGTHPWRDGLPNADWQGPREVREGRVHRREELFLSKRQVKFNNYVTELEEDLSKSSPYIDHWPRDRRCDRVKNHAQVHELRGARGSRSEVP